MAAAAPTDDTQGEGAATDTGLLFACPECQRAFRSARGLYQHRRRTHPAEYHAQNVPVARQKAQWDHEELLILARADIIFRAMLDSNMPGGYHRWQDLTGGHLDRDLGPPGYGLDNQYTQ